MPSRAETEYRYEKLTWPEINDAIDLGKAYEEAVKQLARLVTWFKDRPKDERRDRHRQRPTMEIPWGQRSL